MPIEHRFSATVSARALDVASFISFSGLLHQLGINPHRIGTRSRLPPFDTTGVHNRRGADIVASPSILLRLIQGEPV
jgi:hypothetical protein